MHTPSLEVNNLDVQTFLVSQSLDQLLCLTPRNLEGSRVDSAHSDILRLLLEILQLLKHTLQSTVRAVQDIVFAVFASAILARSKQAANPVLRTAAI